MLLYTRRNNIRARREQWGLDFYSPKTLILHVTGTA